MTKLDKIIPLIRRDIIILRYILLRIKFYF